MSVVGQGRVDGYLSPQELARQLGEGLARLPVDGRRVIVLIPDGTRTMPMPLMFDVARARARSSCGGARLSRRARDAHPDERRGVDAPSRPPGRERHGGTAARLQSPVGRSLDVREPGHDSRARDRRPHGGPPRTGCPGRAQPARRRVRPRDHLRTGLPARGRRASPAARSTCFQASPRPRSSTSRTGSARSLPAPM